MKKILEKYGYCIETWEKEWDDGAYSYWIYLKAGYEVDGQSTIHEYTIRDLKEELKRIKEK